jgi:hypothetical protein
MLAAWGIDEKSGKPDSATCVLAIFHRMKPQWSGSGRLEVAIIGADRLKFFPGRWDHSFAKMRIPPASKWS